MISTLRDFGLTVTQDNFAVIPEKHLVQWEMTKQGIALGMMMEVVGNNALQVERGLSDTEAIFFPSGWLLIGNSRAASVSGRYLTCCPNLWQDYHQGFGHVS